MGGWDLDAVQFLLDSVGNSSSPDFEKDTLVSRERIPQNTRYKSVVLGLVLFFADSPVQ
mgnify:CR=1 FL=1